MPPAVPASSPTASAPLREAASSPSPPAPLPVGEGVAAGAQPVDPRVGARSHAGGGVRVFSLLPRRLADAGVPLEYRRVTIAGVSAPLRPTAEALLRNLPEWVREGRQVILLGGIGVGKSCLLGLLAQAACRADLSVRYATVPQVCTWLHSDSDSEFQAACRARLLLLDDWGAEYATEFHRARLAELVDARWSGNRATAVTSNLTEARLRAEYADLARVWDRLFDARRTTVLTLGGQSRRARA